MSPRFDIFRRRPRPQDRTKKDGDEPQEMQQTPENIERELDTDIAALEAPEISAQEMLHPSIKWPLIRRAHEKRQEVVASRRIDETEFIGKEGYQLIGNKRVRRKHFTDARVKQDLREIERLELENDERDAGEPLKVQYRLGRQKQSADVSESVMVDSIHELFGDDVEIVMTGEFDDRVNGLDFLVIRHDRDGSINQILGFDVTLASEQEVVSKKVERSLRGAARGYLSTAMYIKTQDRDGNVECLSARGIPRIVLGISYASALPIAKRWLYPEDRKTRAFSDERRAGMLYTILEELRAQRYVLKESGAAKGMQEPSFALGELQRAHDWIRAIIVETVPENTKQKSDRTLQRIRDIVRSRRRMRVLYKNARDFVEQGARQRAARDESES